MIAIASVVFKLFGKSEIYEPKGYILLYPLHNIGVGYY